MRLRIIRLCLGISLVIFMGGCAAVGSALNPYEDDFTCSRKAPFGKCETTLEVYAEVVSGDKEAVTVPAEPVSAPAGYEVIQLVDGLPSVSDPAAPSAKEQYRVVKAGPAVSAPAASAPTVSSWKPDAGDGVIYPEATPPKRAEKVAPVTPLPAFDVRPTPETAYRDASLAKAAKLLKEPVTPVVIPPLVMRILILPRKGEDGELNMAQFSYIMVDKPRWAMGDYLSVMPEE